MRTLLRDKGLTLIELLTTMLIVAVLIGLAAPSFNGFLRKQQVEAHQRDIQSIMNYARSEAVTRGETIGVCGKATATTCTDLNIWSQGVLVFVDSDTDGVRDSDEQILRDFAYEGDNELLVNDHSSPINSIYMYFDSRGYLSLFDISDTPPRTAYKQTVTMKICEPNDNLEYARAVLLGTTGRVSLSIDGSDTDEYHQGATGSNLTC